MSEASDLPGATATAEVVGTPYPWHLLARTILLTGNKVSLQNTIYLHNRIFLNTSTYLFNWFYIIEIASECDYILFVIFGPLI